MGLAPGWGWGKSAVAAALAMSAAPLSCADSARFDLAIPAAPLGEALQRLAATTGRSIIVASPLVAGKAAPAVSGRLTLAEALERLLAGSGLRAVQVGSATVIRGEPGGDVGPGAADGADILVTGTRIRGSGPVGSSVIALDRAMIEQGGFGSTQQLVQAVPQNFGGGPNEATTGISTRDNAGLNQAYGASVNLRGLGPSSTLVLLNGNRPALGGFSGVFADLSLIPASAIERVEILPDGASALYGSDAVAGVVNIVPRTRFQGLETSLRLASADGDRQELQLSQLVGTSWGSGRAVLAYEYARNGRLAAADRRFATEDLRAFGGPDLRQLYANPGTISAAGETFAIPAGQNGSGLRADQLRRGEVNLQDQWLGVDLLPAQRRHAAYLYAEQALTPSLDVYVEGLFGRRTYDKRGIASTSNSPRTVTSDNPFYVDPIGSGLPITVFYSFVEDLGPERARGAVEGLGGAVGARLALGPWSIDAHASAGRQDERARLLNVVNAARLAVALADPDPATAYNLFGDGPNTNPATIDRVRGSTANRGRYELWTAQARADGPLFSLPAGDVRLALGSEFRRERFRAFPDVVDVTSAAPTLQQIGGLAGPRRVSAVFAELLVPITAPEHDIPLVRRLQISAAGRFEHYSDFGDTTNPKLGLRWEPIAGVAVRGTYGTSFRAPGFDNLRQGVENRFIFSIALPDPSAPGGQSNALILRGNKPGIGPERARTWTAGIDLDPGVAPGLRLSATWFDIRYRDRIASPAAELFNFLVQSDRFAAIIDRSPTQAAIAAAYADPAFVNFFGIPAAGITTLIDARTQNLSVVRESGLDFQVSYGFALGAGRANLDVNGTWLAKLDQALTAGTQPTDVLNTLGNPVDLRWRASAGWTGGPWTLAAFVNHTADYRNETVAPAEPVRNWTTVDASIGFTVPPTPSPLGGLRVTLSATNLLDRAPPYVRNNNGLFTVGFNPDLSSPLGRVVALQVTKSW